MRPILALFALLPIVGLDGPTRSAYEADPKGWTDLVARGGKELDNWTRVSIPPHARLNPQSQWSVEEATGYLACEGDKGHEWLRFDKEVGDFTLHVEWRFSPVDRDKASYNSGIMAKCSADGSTWLQAQTGGGSGGYLFGEVPGGPRIDLSKALKGKPVKPAGEWNTFELAAKGRDIKLWVNGEVTSAWADCPTARGFVGLEAEGYRITFRNVLLKED